MTSRPNILFITSDQQRGDCYGFEGRVALVTGAAGGGIGKAIAHRADARPG